MDALDQNQSIFQSECELLSALLEKFRPASTYGAASCTPEHEVHEYTYLNAKEANFSIGSVHTYFIYSAPELTEFQY